jgi:hypothetical protein
MWVADGILRPVLCCIPSAQLCHLAGTTALTIYAADRLPKSTAPFSCKGDWCHENTIRKWPALDFLCSSFERLQVAPDHHCYLMAVLLLGSDLDARKIWVVQQDVAHAPH